MHPFWQGSAPTAKISVMSTFSRRREQGRRVSEPASILVRAPNWIGDQVMAFPFFFHLRRAFPGARIGVACPPWVEALQFRDLVDEVAVVPGPSRAGFFNRISVLEDAARKLRRSGPWELGICLPNSLSSAWLLHRAKVKERRGYEADGRSFLLTERLAWPRREAGHRSQDYLDLLPDRARPARTAAEFWGIPAETELDPDIPGELARFDAEKSWPGFTPLEPPEGPYWVLAPGSQAESRRWPVERFAGLARLVQAETGWPGVIVGGAAEAVLADELRKDAASRLLDRTARGPVPVLSRILARARFVVSNDSGLAHVAALCGAPLQVVWGAGDPRRTRPLGPGRARISMQPVDCWPCERNACPLAGARRLRCLAGIQPEMVWREIQSGLIGRDNTPTQTPA